MLHDGENLRKGKAMGKCISVSIRCLANKNSTDKSEDHHGGPVLLM